MDFKLKQWRIQQHKSEEQEQQQQPAAKIPKFLLDSNTADAKLSHLSPFSDSTLSQSVSPNTIEIGGEGGSYLSLELQALISKYMASGFAVPPQLLNQINNSLLHSFQHCSFFQPPLLRAGYWGRSADPEPGRCRRTDGKKWRCSRDVVAAGQKYCERHVHRGRNRSRKPVEIPTPPSSTAGSGNKTPQQ